MKTRHPHRHLSLLQVGYGSVGVPFSWVEKMKDEAAEKLDKLIKSMFIRITMLEEKVEQLEEELNRHAFGDAAEDE